MDFFEISAEFDDGNINNILESVKDKIRETFKEEELVLTK